jgi:hypothetical protein
VGDAEPPQPSSPPTEVQSAELGRILKDARVRPEEAPERPLTFTIGDVDPVRTGARHLWAQELVRASLAIAFFILLALTVVWALWLANGPNWPNAKEALQILLPAETGLLGSATGFYFATRRN